MNNNEFTENDKEWLNTMAVNYIIGQSDGFQQGYAQALNDFSDYLTDYCSGSDDKVHKSIIDALIDCGVELGSRKLTANKNDNEAEKEGFVRIINFTFERKDGTYGPSVRLRLKESNSESEKAND